MLLHGHASELGKGCFEVFELQRVRPVILIGRAQYFENLKNLVDLTVTHEEGLALDHLREDAARGPQVDT